MKASLAQKTKKLFGGFFGFKTFLTVFLIALFFNIGTTKAQLTGPVPSTSVNFDEFACLFTKTDSNGKCTHNPDETNIKTGAESGVVYGKTNTFTEKGVTSITMQLGLWLDVAKEKKEEKYHFSRVADDRSQTFLLRLKYEPVAGYPVYKLIDIPYQKENVEPVSLTKVRTINMDITKGAPQVKIGFYRLGPSGPETVTQQVINAVVDTKVNSGTIVEIPFGATISADFWYCAGERQGSRPSALEEAQGLVNPVDGRRAPKNDPQRPDLAGRVEYFTSDGKYTDKLGSHTDGIPYGVTKCDGTAYFKIGKTVDFKLPESKEAAQIDSQKQVDSGIVSSEYLGSVLPLCSIDPFTNGSVMGCVAQILYGGVFRPVAFFAQLMGNIFDFFLGYSLSDESYRHDFVQTGWQLVRDISNIFFIIIMIWSGLVAIFDTKKASYKTVIPTLIINALIINFSLFATRVVIDLSNITARIFYNQMVVKVDGEIAPSSSGFKPISEAIVSSFNPQSIFRNSVLQSEDFGSDTESSSATTADFNSQSKNQTEGAKFKRYSREYASYFALVTLIAIMISFSVAVMFWKTAFIFIGRVVGLYVAMIFSPFAFLSRGKLPLVSSIPSINYSAWWKDLTQYALLAPIFVFFLYIINAFLNVEFFTKVGLDQNGQGFFGSVMYVLIPMLIIYGLVTKGVSVANKFAGDLGGMAQKMIGGVAGVAVGGTLGVATGGIAVAGRNVVGRLGTRLASSQTLQNASSRGGILGGLADRVMRSGGYLSRSTYDARNITAVNNRLREFGTTNTRVGGFLGTNQTNTAGGFTGAIEREMRTQTGRADRFLLTGQQAAAQDARNAVWENNYQTARNNAQQTANAAGAVFDENTFRTTYIAQQATTGNTRPQTSAEINRQRERQNNARLQRGSLLARISRQVTNRATTPGGTAGATIGGAGLATGAIGTTVAGGLTAVAATVIGQGAIENAAQQQVARQRAGNARDPLSATQIQRLQDKLTQLQQELTRRISVMNTIGGTFNPPVTFANLTPANIIDYQNNRQADINLRQTQIDAEQDFIDQNINNTAMRTQINQARSTIRNLSNEQNTLRNDIKQAGNILNEFNRIQTDMNNVRQQLGI